VSARPVIAALGGPRADWPTVVARWATSGMISADMTHCLTADELRALVGSGMLPSIVLVDAAAAGLDRDLVGAARRTGAMVVGVHCDGTVRDWEALGCDDVIDPPSEPAAVVHLLERLGRRPRATPPEVTRAMFRRADEQGAGRLVAVTGSGGVGASTVSMLLAQGLAQQGAAVGLVDGCRRASHSLYHDIRRPTPGLQELVEAHAAADIGPAEVRRMLRPTSRGYSVLPGLRRHRDWTVLRGAAVRATLESLRRTYDWVVVDIDHDVDREATTGSFDVEDRHSVSVGCVRRAAVLLVVGTTDMQGLHRSLTLTEDLVDAGAARDALVPVLNRMRRSRVHRAAVLSTHADLRGLDAGRGGGASDHVRGEGRSPVVVPVLRRLEAAHRDVAPLPSAAAVQLARRVRALAGSTSRPTEALDTAVPLDRGSIGTHLTSQGSR